VAVLRRAFWPTLFAMVAGGGLVFAFWPRPVLVDLVPVTRGPLEVVVADDGETQVRNLYVVSAPLPGRVLRVTAKVGDLVVANETVLATMLPTEPTFLDPRTRAEQQATARAADAARAYAEAELRRQQAELDYARAELGRTRELFQRGHVAQAAMDRVQMEVRTHEAAVGTARAALRQRQFEFEAAELALLTPSPDSPLRQAKDSCCFPIRSPITGRVLRIRQESEAVVAAGAPLLEIGDIQDLEIVTDLLSSEAVKVSPGDPVRILRWGGPGALQGRVRRIEPFGRTKVSALGIEEQRVDVVVDIVEPPERWARLGHGYRVDIEIVLWQESDVLQIPLGALFRLGDSWAAFGVVASRAEVRRLELGRVNDRAAEVKQGLAPGDLVIVNPSDRIAVGRRVEARAPIGR
jgi:HlyD family secretion protein